MKVLSKGTGPNFTRFQIDHNKKVYVVCLYENTQTVQGFYRRENSNTGLRDDFEIRNLRAGKLRNELIDFAKSQV